MFAESETELRDLIIQNLETCGFLSKIKAELRAGVFLALSEEGNLRKKIPVANKRLDDFIDTNEGKLAISIVREFLEFYNLNFTLSVFDPEIANPSLCLNRSDLCNKFNLNEIDNEESILSSLLKHQLTSKIFDTCVEKSKRLETITEDFTIQSKDMTEPSNSSKESGKNSINEHFPVDLKLDNDIFQNIIEKPIEDAKKCKDFVDLGSPLSNADNDVFKFSKTEQKDIFQDNSSHDPFFDEPLPSEKTDFLHLSSISSGFKEQNKLVSNTDKLFGAGSLSSLKDLPSLTPFNKEEPKKDLPSLMPFNKEEAKKDLPYLMPFNKEEPKKDLHSLMSLSKEETKKDLDPESTEELSDRQLNSEESIEEEIEDEYSAGLDDLLNSSLSLGEDATSDQTVSQTSVVDGVDHMESCQSMN